MPPLTDKAAFFARTETEEGTVGQWQPIESAPKDGTRVLLAFTGHPFGDWCVISGGHDPSSSTEWRDLFHGEMVPTHWMPLPSPPSDAALGNPQVAE